MEKSGFFNANQVGEGYDREYLAQDFASYFASFISNGVFINPSTALQLTASTGRNVVLDNGQAWINGYWYSNLNDKIYIIDASDGILNRIDSFVLQLNFSERTILSSIKKGISANTPEPYIPQRNADVYELVLAQISVPKGSIEVRQEHITDTRLNNNLCGIVHGLIEQVDTTTIFNQFQAYYNRKVIEWNAQMTTQQDQWQDQTNEQQTIWQTQTDEQQDSHITQQQELKIMFMLWFETIKDILDGDVAGNLLNLINALTIRVTLLEGVIFNDIDTNPYLIRFDNLNGISANGVWNESLQRLEC